MDAARRRPIGVDNAPTMNYTFISAPQAEPLAGIDFFAALKDAVEKTAMALPAPTSLGSRDKGRVKADDP